MDATGETIKPAVLRSFRGYLGTFRFSLRAFQLVWTTSPRLTLLLAFLTLIAGLFPAAIAFVGKLIVDGVVAASRSGLAVDRWQALTFVGWEAGLVVLLAGVQKGIQVSQSLLRVQLAQQVNEMILEKALTLELRHFEDSEFYDGLTRARREASRRPMSLIQCTFGLAQNGITLLTYGGLLLQFSPWAVLFLVLGAVPAFVVEARFSNEAFRLFSWRVPETRQQYYLETAIAREDYVKETMLFQTGRLFLRRYQDIFQRLFKQDRSLTLRRGFWGYTLGLLSTAAFYGAYGWIAWETIAGQITLGDMTMYLLVFKQGQSAVAASLSSIGGLYEDNLYLSTLYEFLEQEVTIPNGEAIYGPSPGDGLRFEDISFTYPGADKPALQNVSLHLKPGQKLALVGENGSGKTTLIKLLTRLYAPSGGRILWDGLDLQEWDIEALRKRVGVIFQDFVRYQFTIGENIGIGDVEHIEDEDRWKAAAVKGMAHPFIEPMKQGYQTQLGRWFKDGRELSMGEWQKIALSRAFMRADADILVLDEPTSTMDAAAESQIFDRFRQLTETQMAILISHRFSTVRMADYIVVLHEGRIIEQGTHDELVQDDGQYARLFNLQAKGYR